jgi:LPS sulfotransferase NodH
MPWPFRSTPAVGRPFVIVFPGRTGSSWLVSALAAHPSVEVQGEILVRQAAEAQRRLVRAALVPGRRVTARGFKTKMKDVADPDDLRDAIVETNALVIQMRRADLLRLALSRINARRLHDATGRWNRTAEMPESGVVPVTTEELQAALEACVDEVSRVETFVESVSGDVMDIRYADILRTPDEVLASVQTAIGVEPRTVRSGVVKNTDEDLRPWLPDFDGWRRWFADTPFAAAFEIDPTRER